MMKREGYKSRVGLLLLLTLLCLSSQAPSAEARCKRVLLIQYGDSHSRYDRVIQFLALVRKTIAEFKADCPSGQVVLIASGDISARSAFSFDKGWLNIWLLKHLALRYPGVWVQGNHEALDWRGVEGRELYLQQMAAITTQETSWPFSKHPGDQLPPLTLRGITPVAANLAPAPAMQEYLKPFRDIPIHNGRKKLRIVGMTLDDYFQRAVYDLQLQPRLFRSVSKIEAEMYEQMRNAVTDNVDWLIPALHEEMIQVRPLATKIAGWRQRDAAMGKIRMPAIFAADDHLVAEEQISGFHVFDSGCDYAMRAVELNRHGEVSTVKFFRPQDLSRLERAGLQKWLLDEDIEFIDRYARSAIRDAVDIARRKIGVLYGTSDTRNDFKKRRTELGTIISDAFVLFAEHIVRTERMQYIHLPVVGLLNSSTYRREDPIAYDELTVGDVQSMLPYFQPPAIAVLSGRDIQTKYAELRAYRVPHVLTPQMSSNLREAPTPGEPYRLIYRVGPEQWVPISELDQVVMIADHWLMSNGYNLPSWQDVVDLEGIKPKETKLEIDVLEENFAGAHNRYRRNGGHSDLYSGSCGGNLKLYRAPAPDIRLHTAS